MDKYFLFSAVVVLMLVFGATWLMVVLLSGLAESLGLPGCFSVPVVLALWVVVGWLFFNRPFGLRQ